MNLDLMKSQARLEKLTITSEPAGPYPDAATVAVGQIKLYVLNIIDREAEIARLTKRAEELTRGVKGIEGKLSNEGFISKAPAEVVQRERERLESLRSELTGVNKALESLR